MTDISKIEKETIGKMVNYHVTQNSPEWYALSIGRLTASNFSDILTPAKGELSASRLPLQNAVVAEILTGECDEPFFMSDAMKRGAALEPKAREMYELVRGVPVHRSGFVTTLDGRIGGSADGLVGDDGGIEIKCMYGGGHVGMLNEKDIAAKHKPQVQGLLYITGRKWWDVMAYHPKMPPSIIRVERDVLYIAKLEAALKTMIEEIDAKVEAIKAMGA